MNRLLRITLTALCVTILAATASLVAASPATVTDAQAATLTDLAWLVGNWQSGEGEAVRFENWSQPAGGMMLGAHLDVLSSGRTDYEFLRIAETAQGIVYFASPSGRSPATPFPLIESGEQRAVFANPEHDFPKRLIYWIAEDGALHARAEGDDGQGPEWRWERR